jgi:hypothetical protein
MTDAFRSSTPGKVELLPSVTQLRLIPIHEVIDEPFATYFRNEEENV